MRIWCVSRVGLYLPSYGYKQYVTLTTLMSLQSRHTSPRRHFQASYEMCPTFSVKITACFGQWCRFIVWKCGLTLPSFVWSLSAMAH